MSRLALPTTAEYHGTLDQHEDSSDAASGIANVMTTDPQPRRRRPLVVLFFISAALVLASWLVLESGPKPCNPDDLTGCSAIGEVALGGFFLSIPLTIGFGLILFLNWVTDLLRRN